MNFIQKLFQFYVFSNLHVSVSVACFTLITGVLFKENVSLEASFLACATFVSYHFTRYMNRLKYGKRHLLDSFSNEYKHKIQFLVCLAILYCIVCTFYIEFTQIVRLVPFGMITLFYGVSFIKIKEKRYSIRYIPGLKIFIISITWAGVVVFFPLEFGVITFRFFIQLLLLVVVLTLPFDIRDVLFDKGKVKTLPMIFGIQRTKIYGTFLLFGVLILHYFNFGTYYFMATILTAVILIALLWKSTSNQSTYYASFWVEGIPILYFLLTILDF